MKIAFADDAAQRHPTRPGMRALVAVGGVILDAQSLGPVQDDLDELCAEAGFPSGEEFKWSPSRDQWMHQNLIQQERRAFFRAILATLQKHGVETFVVLEDVESGTATGCATATEDVVVLFLERIANRLADTHSQGLVVTDRPGGSRTEDDEFLASCADTVQAGTAFVALRDQILAVYSAPSNLSRLLQAADVVAGCTTALVAGETRFAPDVFQHIKPMFPRKYDRIGGPSLKIHPDFRYSNLYHWLCGDSHFVRYQTGIPMPLKGRPYFAGPDQY